jgi:hypothetical protein
MNTIVSAFVSNVNNRYIDSITQYYELGKPLLISSVPKIIFVDKIMLDCIGDNYNKTNTFLVEIDKHDSYLYKFQHLLNKFQLNSTNYSKDTIEFMFTMCNKTEWIRKAIEINYFNTDHFIWIDFGIRHVFKEFDNDIFTEKINSLQFKLYNNVRIGSIWDIKYNYGIDIYKDVAWYFAGGVFGGNLSSLIKFADLMMLKCIQIMKEKNTIMWEVNIWYLIYLDNKDLFNIYNCDHNNTLIDNY